jgi:hypothetical protein
MPWQSTAKVDFTTKFTTLRYKEDYLEIQKFLTTESLVNQVLKLFEGAIFADCNSPDAFLERLGELETQYRFSAQVVTVNTILKAVDFIMYVHAARPLHDLGAGDAHGFATHRVQWMMVACYAETNPGKIRTPVSELYSNLACANAYAQKSAGPYNAQTGDGWDFLWDDLFDRFFFKPPRVQNATSPEYLHSVHLESQFRKLARIWP